MLPKTGARVNGLVCYCCCCAFPSPFPLSPLLLLFFSALLCAMLLIMSRRRARRERGAEKTFPPSSSNPSSLEERGLLRPTNFFEWEEKKGANWDMGGECEERRGAAILNDKDSRHQHLMEEREKTKNGLLACNAVQTQKLP